MIRYTICTHYFLSLTNLSTYDLNSSLSRTLNKISDPKSHQKSTFAKTNAETKMWASPGMETRKTIAIFSSCQRPTSPEILDFCFTFFAKNGFLLYYLWIFSKNSACTYYSNNLILRRIRLLLQFLFLLHSDTYVGTTLTLIGNV